VAAALVACGAGALGAGFLAAGPALAAPAPDAVCGKSGQPLCAPKIDITTSESAGMFTITWTSDGPLDTVNPGTPTLTWVQQPNTPVTAPPMNTNAISLSGPGCTGSTTVVCTYSWPSTLEISGFVINGTYTLSASAEDCVLLSMLCSTTTTTTVTPAVAVANVPPPPTNVTASQGPNLSTVKISWNRNPEPDIAGYQVLRSDGSSACLVPATVQNPAQYSCIDSPTKDGAYKYTVVADRWGATYDTHVDKQAASTPSSPPTKAVIVSGTSANTTTTVAAGTAGTLGPVGFVPKLTPTNSATGGGGGAAFNPKLAPAVTTPAAPVDTPANGDTGFLPSLPYGQRAAPTTTTDPAVITVPAAPHKAKATSVGSIAVVGAGLLLAVIALHGLWLRSEVRRSGALEVLEPRA
jgi:hypothetical protein